VTGTASININGTVGATTANTMRGTTIEGTDTTDASSTTTGALKTAGGLAVAKKVYTGDNVVPAAAKGVNFTGNTPAAGMTSQLLNWYEEGTWTPALGCGTSGTITITSPTNKSLYTRIGRQVTVQSFMTISSVSTPVGDLTLTGIPYSCNSLLRPSGVVILRACAATAVTSSSCLMIEGTNTIIILTRYAAGTTGTFSQDIIASAEIYVTMTYFI